MKNEKGRDFVPDKALRYIYSALRNLGCFFMAFELTDHDGRKWRVDTVDEAMALRDRLLESEMAHSSIECMRWCAPRSP